MDVKRLLFVVVLALMGCAFLGLAIFMFFTHRAISAGVDITLGICCLSILALITRKKRFPPFTARL